jgi:hypothetical protein
MMPSAIPPPTAAPTIAPVDGPEEAGGGGDGDGDVVELGVGVVDGEGLMAPASQKSML